VFLSLVGFTNCSLVAGSLVPHLVILDYEISLVRPCFGEAMIKIVNMGLGSIIDPIVV
jgi:hypothetical protein